MRPRHRPRAGGTRCLRHLQPDVTLRTPNDRAFKVGSLTAAHVVVVEVFMMPVATATGFFIWCVDVNSCW